MRAAVLSALALALACGGCARDLRPRPGVPPRHVVLVTASSLRADHLSCYLYPRPTSQWPADEADREARRDLALDDVASQGVLFLNAFSPANRTRPALEALFTGQSRTLEGELPELDPEFRTLAEVFRDAGFQTAAFTSGLPLNERLGARGWDRGFEHSDYRFGDTPALVLAKEWLAARRDERPLFLWVHLSGCDPPHDPRAVPPRLERGLGAQDYTRHFTDPAYDGDADGSFAYIAAIEGGTAALAERDRQQLVDLYDGEVARLSSGLRDFLLFARHLRPPGGTLDLLTDSAFVFSGLHGIELGEHGRSLRSQSSLFESVLRVPLVLRHPNSLTGSRILSEPVGLEDVAPTLCDWFELDPPTLRAGTREGRSLLALVDSYVRRPFASRPAVALCTTPARAAALRDREWSLLWSTAGESAGVVSLFERARDGAELRDVSALHPEVVAELWPLLESRLGEAGWR